MIRAAAFAAITIIGCAESTELLPSFCPTRIDVFGPDDTLFSACGGPTMPVPQPSGYFAPGSPDYDASLAGRLQSALSADGALAARFAGRAFKVRACGTPQQWLSALAPDVPSGECTGADAPPGGAGVNAAIACTDQPAPVALIAAAEPLDRCHGGGSDTARSDDEATFDDHIATRLDGILRVRKPPLALVGAQPEWTPQPGAMPMDRDACAWRRGDWSTSGLARWASRHAGSATAVALDVDLHAAFKSHGPCCGPLAVACQQPAWLAPPAMQGTAQAQVSCEGASAIAARWVEKVRAVLLTGRFDCSR